MSQARKIIDFSSPNAPEALGKVFAQAIVQRWEGLVLKRCGDSCFSLNSAKAFIELKKDCTAGLGDTADFAIVGRHRDAKDEQELGIGKLCWTSFYIGCLENKDEVCRFNTRTRFRIINRIDRHGRYPISQPAWLLRASTVCYLRHRVQCLVRSRTAAPASRAFQTSICSGVGRRWLRQAS
jgi:hypothetical protein